MYYLGINPSSLEPYSIDLAYIITAAVYLCGLLAAIDALFLTKSSQGAIAWSIALVMFPIISLPIYLVFSRPKLKGYKKLAIKYPGFLHNKNSSSSQSLFTQAPASLSSTDLLVGTVEKIVGSPFSRDNTAQLYKSGEEFFKALIADIESTTRSISLSFYVVRSDDLGHKIKSALIRACQRGVRVRFIYDKIGSLELGRDFIEELRQAGIEILEFHTRVGFFNWSAANCRNHRKLSIFDEEVAYTGGFNLGTEYLKGVKDIGPWRDTQIRITGPEVRRIQEIFNLDWRWVSGENMPIAIDHCKADANCITSNSAPNSHAPSSKQEHNLEMITIATSCADEREECILFFLALINAAQHRLWIAGPYFVPDDSIIQAINLASARGVDVRLLVPNKSDNIFTSLAAEFYFPQVSIWGVKIYKYDAGFMHQKVLLVDDEIAVVGSANLDNRSMRLSFESMTVVRGYEFAARVAAMLKEDLDNSTEQGLMRFDMLPLPKRVASNICRLFSPLL